MPAGGWEPRPPDLSSAWLREESEPGRPPASRRRLQAARATALRNDRLESALERDRLGPGAGPGAGLPVGFESAAVGGVGSIGVGAVCRAAPSRSQEAEEASVGKIYDEIGAKLEGWIAAQPMFFVATAPLEAGGHVNVSPKGPASAFRVLGPRQVAYLDIVGSGTETIAHLRENGRIVVMFCAFVGPPRIVRLHGSGAVAQIGTARFDELQGLFDVEALEHGGICDVDLRSVVEIDVTRIADSCGFGVPLMRFESWRPQGRDWADNRLRTHGPNALLDYSRELNAESIDGLPGIDPDVLPQRS